MGNAPGIRGGEVRCETETVGRASAMTFRVKAASRLSAGIPSGFAEKRERPMAPDGLKGVGQDVAEQKLPFPEKEVAGVDRAVRHQTQLRGPCRTTNVNKPGLIPDIRNEA